MKLRSSMVIVVIATLLGLFFGYILGGWLWLLILGVVAAVAALYSVTRYESVPEIDRDVHVDDPPFARFLFRDTRSAALWLPIRLFVGWSWLDAGMHKFNDPKWMETGETIRGFWAKSLGLTPATPGAPAPKPTITYDWWSEFIRGLYDNNAHTWFAKVITFGELLVGLGLILGALVGIAAFGGILMNMAYLLTGTTSSNPVLLIMGIMLLLGWKVAGWLGLDRFLLPLLGTPWHKGALLQSSPAPPVRST
jgi:thiosulfate dehydrogenase [quinone] large subunit